MYIIIIKVFAFILFYFCSLKPYLIYFWNVVQVQNYRPTTAFFFYFLWSSNLVDTDQVWYFHDSYVLLNLADCHHLNGSVNKAEV